MGNKPGLIAHSNTEPPPSIEVMESMLSAILLAFGAAFLTTWLMVGVSWRWPEHTLDLQGLGPQNVHTASASRIGGLGIVAGLLASLLVAVPGSDPVRSMGLGLLAAATPAFCTGLLEDMTRQVAPRARLLATVAASLVAAVLLDLRIIETDLPLLDTLVSFTLGSLLLTAFVVSGVSHAVNIVDGFHGLASGSVMLMLAGLAWVAHLEGDELVLRLALAGLAACLGFLVWNYPAGRIFLGDGGAYFLGFYVAELGLLLTRRHGDLSPLFPLVLCAYPVIETVYSIWRRRQHRRRQVMQPDCLHLHSLIYRQRLSELRPTLDCRDVARANTLVAPVLWAYGLGCVLLALTFRNNTPALCLSLAIAGGVYLSLYRNMRRCLAQGPQGSGSTGFSRSGAPPHGGAASLSESAGSQV